MPRRPSFKVVDMQRPTVSLRTQSQVTTAQPGGAPCRERNRRPWDPECVNEPAACTTVPTFPPARSGRLMTPGRSSDSRTQAAACLLATEPAKTRQVVAMARMQSPSRSARQVAQRSIARTQRRGRPGFTPVFPVCLQRAAAAAGHQSRWQSIPAGGLLSTEPAASVRPARFTSRGPRNVKPCGSWAGFPSSSNGRRRPRRSHETVVMRGIFCPTRRPSGGQEKTLEHVQAASIRPPIATVSPGASMCPSGNQGATVTCNSRVTEWLDRPVAKKFVDHILGVTASRAGRTLRWSTSKGDVAR